MINQIQQSTIEAIRRKSPAILPDRPSEQGYSGSQIRGTFHLFVTDTQKSIIAEIGRVIAETNAEITALSSITENHTLLASGWNSGAYELTPTADFSVKNNFFAEPLDVGTSRINTNLWRLADISCEYNEETNKFMFYAGTTPVDNIEIKIKGGI